MRWVVRWWKNRQARKAHAALVTAERNTWRVVDSHVTRCTDISYGMKNYEGDIVIVAEVNNLKERRVRCLSCPKRWKPQESTAWSSYKIWEAKAEPRSLPFQEIA